MPRTLSALATLSFTALLPAIASAQCPVSFSTPTQSATVRAVSMATADFNGDGKPDIALGSISGTNACTVMLNEGFGTFAAPTTIPLSGTSPNGVNIATADFNGDGFIDIAAAAGSNQLSILLNTGNGTFAAPANTALSVQPYFTITGDFNNDGKRDIAFSIFSGSGGLGVFYGNGNGTFAPMVTVPIFVLTLATADFNGDGKFDIVSSNPFTNTVTLFPGTGAAGTGAFTTGASYPLSNGAAITAGDVNGDGLTDFVVGLSSSVAVFTGNGAGSFTNAGTFAAGSGTIGSCAIADFNGDGKVDIQASPVNSSATILLANGAGSTVSFAAPVSINPGVSGYNAISADLNGDGSPDVVQNGSISAADRLFSILNTAAGFRRPVVTLQPVSQVVAPGASVTYTCAANGIGTPLAYRWRRNGVLLSNGGNISGATTLNLTINPVTAADEALYQFEATCVPLCGNFTLVTRSYQTALAVTGAAPTGCTADLGAAGGFPGHDGLLDNNDFIAFINAFFDQTGCP